MKVVAQKATRRSYWMVEKDGTIYLYPAKVGKAPAKAQIGTPESNPSWSGDMLGSGCYKDLSNDLGYTLGPLAKAAKGKVVKVDIQIDVGIALSV